MKTELIIQFSTKITEATDRMIREHASEHGLKINWITDNALREWLERRHAEEKDGWN